jgi:hypothetical protein
MSAGIDEVKALSIVKQVASQVISFKEELEGQLREYQDYLNSKEGFLLPSKSFEKIRKEKTDELLRKLDNFVYEYFSLTEEEIALVEETYEIYEKSATPDRPNQEIPTLRKTTKTDRNQYSSWLCLTLNKWAQQATQAIRPLFIFTADSTKFQKLGQVLVTIHKKQKESNIVDLENPSEEMGDALRRISEASIREKGCLSYLRGIIFSDRGKIHILKPDILGKWTRTAALNDAQRLFDLIITSQKSGAWK